MRTPHLTLILAVALLTSCAPASRDATASKPKQLASECATALNAKDYSKAQKLAKEATSIDPKFAEAWVGYGMASVRLGQSDQARAAYEQALSLHQARHVQNPSDANQVFQQIFLLALLGRQADAGTLLKQAHTNYPSDPQITQLAGDFTVMKQGWHDWMVEATPIYPLPLAAFPEPRVYLVQPGDSATLIAKNLCLSVEMLSALNPGVDWSHLKMGQRLYYAAPPDK